MPIHECRQFFAHLRLSNPRTHWSFPLCASRDGSIPLLFRPLRSSLFACSWGRLTLRCRIHVRRHRIDRHTHRKSNPRETSPFPRYAGEVHCAWKPRSHLHNRNCGLGERSKLAAVGLRRRGGTAGLYVNSGWIDTLLLPHMNEDRAATIRAAIERRFPGICIDVKPISILFGDRIGLTTLDLNNLSGEGQKMRP
jgi:hypothetical protein